MDINIKQLQCKRCGHLWYPRKPEIITCPKCKSPYWNKPSTRIFRTTNKMTI